MSIAVNFTNVKANDKGELQIPPKEYGTKSSNLGKEYLEIPIVGKEKNKSRDSR